MTTLAVMKARILSETARPDLADAIASEITSAINYYRAKRFWFTERRSRVTFSTAIGQSDYAAAAQADIPNLISLDGAFIVDNGHTRELYLCPPDEMEIRLGSISTADGVPACFSYYEQVLRLWPIPDAVYPIRLTGVVRVTAPASDAEASNPWMTDAEELIRSRAKRNLYLNWMLGTEPTLIQTMKGLEDEAFDRLTAETSSRKQVRRVRPSYF